MSNLVSRFAFKNSPAHTSFLRNFNRFLTIPSKEWLIQHNRAPQSGPAMPPDLPTRHRRIVYRSRNRGWLELDILMGGWAAKHVKTLDEEKVCQMEQLLDADTPDVLKWVLGQEEPPVRFDNDVMTSLRAYAEGEGLVADR